MYINNIHSFIVDIDTPEPEHTRDRQILEKAIEAVEQETDLRINVVDPQTRTEENVTHQRDAVLRIDGVEYHAEIMAWAQHATMGAVIDMVKRNLNGILVADYVNPRMADGLREAEVQFIDTAGNAFVKTPLHHIQIKGNRKPDAFANGGKPRKWRAFTTTGLKVTYAFLCQPELVTAPYREIATRTSVALGTVAKVIDDLAEASFLEKREGQRRLVRLEAILATWVERYPATLRPKLQLGAYKAETPDWWKHFNLAPLDAYWGGEIAGAHYTDYLKPAVATVYIPTAMQIKLIATAHLHKIVTPTGEPGTVELLKPFWHPDGRQTRFVHPILAYADLIATADARNLEVAQMLYEQRVAQHLR